MSIIQNPIIPGYYPDPSICRVGEDYYLACSSFEIYPGVPLFHSKDLAHWEQIANIMTMQNGFHVEHSYGANGVMAPTLRFHNGTFYMINANFQDGGNYIVTAKDPKGPWSEPHRLSDVPGIDASLFFDDDGRCYILGTGECWDNGAGGMERGIWLAKYDIETFRMAGIPVTIFNSALRGGASPEAPHIYHKGGYYYLIIAEGGTEFYHSVCAARSKDLFGFYENCPANPVMTHRMMGTWASVGNVGHADLVETPEGKWYAVTLASRAIEGRHKCMGRETWICPVEWENDWPLFSPQTGRLEMTYPASGLKETLYPPVPARDEFDSDTLGLYWTHWGTPYGNYWEIRDSKLYIRAVRQDLIEPLESVRFDAPKRTDSYAPFIARRQTQFDFEAACRMTFRPEGTETAGLAIVQAFNHQYHFEMAKGCIRVVLYTSAYTSLPFLPGFSAETKAETVGCIPWEKDSVYLRIICRGRDYTFLCEETEDTPTVVAHGDAAKINTEQLGPMAGTMIGMFATGHGADTCTRAAFDWFEIKE